MLVEHMIASDSPQAVVIDTTGAFDVERLLAVILSCLTAGMIGIALTSKPKVT